MIKNFLGKNIQYLRKERRMSQQVLADQLSLTRSKVASYENGKAEPSINKLVSLARFFNVSIDRLIEEDLRLIPDTKMLVTNANEVNGRVGLVEDSNKVVQNFEHKVHDFRKIADGFKAFHNLKKSTLTIPSESVHSLLGDFENILSVLDNLVESNEAFIQNLKKIQINNPQPSP